MDPRIRELHCIMPLANIPSVLANGILSHERIAKLPHASVAMDEVQARRAAVTVPGGLKLHQYANLYFHARNPMLSKRRDRAGELCVLGVATEVLALPGVVITDANASSDYVRFYSPAQLALLPLDDIFAESWVHADDRIATFRHKSRKCAEVLVPGVVPPSTLIRALVVDAAAESVLRGLGFTRPITVDPTFFFR